MQDVLLEKRREEGGEGRKNGRKIDKASDFAVWGTKSGRNFQKYRRNSWTTRAASKVHNNDDNNNYNINNNKNGGPEFWEGGKVWRLKIRPTKKKNYVIFSKYDESLTRPWLGPDSGLTRPWLDPDSPRLSSNPSRDYGFPLGRPETLLLFSKTSFSTLGKRHSKEKHNFDSREAFGTGPSENGNFCPELP